MNICTKCKYKFYKELQYKTCEKCRLKDKISKQKNKCEHDRQKSRCKDCKGSQICEHNILKYFCKVCKGSQICEHNNIKSYCKECGGKSLCKHNKEKSKCKDCKGSQICEHNKIKSFCKECGGKSLCEHNKRKSDCKDCNYNLYLVNLQRKQMRKIFEKSNLNKTKSSIKYLGCDIKEYINHIQNKIKYFNDFIATDIQMNTNNIHLDHIKPVSKFNLKNENEFLECCHYTNIQPLLIKDNLEKNNKWTDKNEKYWNDNIKGNKNFIEIYF